MATYSERSEKARINGVGIAALQKTVRGIEQAAARGKCRFQVRNQWIDGGHTRTVVKDFFAAGRNHKTSRTRPLVAESDIPSLLGGSGTAMDPLEYLLAALAGSVTTTLVWHAAGRGIHIDAVESHVEGDIDLRGCLALETDVRCGFEQIRLQVKLDAEATDAQLDELLDIARRLSPVVNTISRETPISIERS